MAESSRGEPDRAASAAKVALAFLIAPGVASLGFALFLGAPALVGIVAAVAYGIALLLGVPAYLVLRLRGPPTLLRATLTGGLIVALPVLAFLLSQEVP